MFLPPYSPDLNPIEQVFAKLKTLIRKAEERTVDGLWRRIGGSLEAFTPRECANYLRNAESGQTRAGKTLSKLALLKLSPRLLAVQRIDDAANQIGVEQPFGGEFAAQRTQAL